MKFENEASPALAKQVSSPLAHDIKNKVVLSFSLLWACFAIWAINLHFTTTIADQAILRPLFHTMRFGMFFMAPCMIIFFVTVTRTRVTIFLRAIIALSLIVSASLYLSNMTFLPSVLKMVGSRVAPVPDIISETHKVNFVAASLTIFIVTFRAYHTAVFREKQRLKWLVIAITLGCILGILSFNNSRLFGVIGSLIGMPLVAYAVLRFHVISVSEAFGYAAIKLTSAVIVLSGFVLLFRLIEQADWHVAEQLVVTLLAGLALLELYRYLLKSFSDARDLLFPAEHYEYDVTIEYLLKALKNCNSISRFFKFADEVFLRMIKVKSYTLHVFPAANQQSKQDLRLLAPAPTNNIQIETLPPSPLNGSALLQWIKKDRNILFYDDAPANLRAEFQKLNASVCVPLHRENKLEGVFILGAPTKKEKFSQNDDRLLYWLSKQAGFVLETVLAKRWLENTLDEAEKTLSDVARHDGHIQNIKSSSLSS